METPRSILTLPVAALIAVALSACGSDSTAGNAADATATPMPSSAAASETPSGERSTTDPDIAIDSIVAQAVATEVGVFEAPSPDAPLVVELANPVETGGPLVFSVTDAERREDWIEVMLPIRPNGSTGWIRTEDVELTRNEFRLEIDISEHTLIVLDRSGVMLRTLVGVGTGETPTPTGSFYIDELLAPTDPEGPYGPFAFGLSGFSNSLDSFNSGDGVIGIHGTNEPASLGADASHGCIRVANETIADLASFLPLGTPVHIVR